MEGLYANVSRHHTSYRDAIEANGPIKPDVLEQVRGQYTGEESRWIREMEAEFADDDDRWIPMSLIMKCIVPGLKPTPDEVILEDVDQTEEGRKLLAQIRGIDVQPDWDWITSNYNQLLSDYSDKWIAVKDKKVVDSDPDQESLLQKLREKYGTALDFAKEFITAKPQT